MLSHAGSFSSWRRRRWRWRDVRSSANKTPSLWAGGRSNELPWVDSRLMEMACPLPSPPPHSANPALIGGRRKRDFRFTGNNALVKKEKKNSISASSECEPLHPNYNFQLRSEDYISQYVLRPRTRTCVKWEVSGVLFGRHAKNLLFFHIILITFLAQSTWGLLLLLTAKRPDEWNPNALYWWNIVIAGERLLNLNNQWHLLLSSCVLTPASFIFKYFIIKLNYL